MDALSYEDTDSNSFAQMSKFQGALDIKGNTNNTKTHFLKDLSFTVRFTNKF